MVRIITLFFFCLFLQNAAAQISCGTNAVHEQLLRNSSYKAMIAARKPLVVTDQSFFAEPDIRDTIQVVIHIIHQGAPLGSDANPADDYIRDVFKTGNECFKGEYMDDRGLNK